jgi:transposase-like protein
MWVEKSREQLELLHNRFLGDPDWLAILIDGVWLTRELCVVVAVGIDIEGKKQVLDFEQGPSENTTVVSELISRLAKRGVRANEQRRLLVLRDGSAAIAAAVKRMWPEAVQQECLVQPIPTFATSCADVTGRIWIFVSRRCARRREP